MLKGESTALKMYENRFWGGKLICKIDSESSGMRIVILKCELIFFFSSLKTFLTDSSRPISKLGSC